MVLHLFLLYSLTAAIRDGYKLEFDSEPPPSMLANNKSARERPDFVEAELTRLEKLGCIVKVDQRPKVVNPMSVVCECSFASHKFPIQTCFRRLQQMAPGSGWFQKPEPLLHCEEGAPGGPFAHRLHHQEERLHGHQRPRLGLLVRVPKYFKCFSQLCAAGTCR